MGWSLALASEIKEMLACVFVDNPRSWGIHHSKKHSVCGLPQRVAQGHIKRRHEVSWSKDEVARIDFED